MALPLILIKKKQREREREGGLTSWHPMWQFTGVDLIHVEVSYGHPSICLPGIHV